jgi:hypothetical protein
VLALLALLIMPAAAYAEDPAPPDPPQGRMGPPIGMTAEPEPGFFEELWSWLLAQLESPIG